MGLNNNDFLNIVFYYGKNILNSKKIKPLKGFIQHGNYSVYEHSISVALYALKIAYYFNINVDVKSLVRGCLLHDYFLYDWHIYDESHKWHGFTHAKVAMKNASRDFKINDIEKNMIFCHMFPLNIRFPKYKEAWILCMADKLSAIVETVGSRVNILLNLFSYDV